MTDVPAATASSPTGDAVDRLRKAPGRFENAPPRRPTDSVEPA